MFRKILQFLEKQNTDDCQNCFTEAELLRMELKQIQTAMDGAYSVLQNVTEPELIDSAIYELNSIQMKYTFLYKKYKELL